jgi:biotin operon repressor
MPKSLINSIEMGQVRYLMADTVVRVCEGFTSDYLPDFKVWDAFPFLVILRKMIENAVNRRSSNATSLARALGMSRTTVQRRLTQLKRIGAVEQHGARYVVIPSFMNHPKMIAGYKSRRDQIGSAHRKMTETGTTSQK